MRALGQLSSGPAKGRKGVLHHRWVPLGTRSVTRSGYVKVKTENGWEREHRVVAKTPAGKVTHHKDENRSNNVPDNLEPMARGEHQSLHARKYWARVKEI
jgi:hypothetical protein